MSDTEQRVRFELRDDIVRGMNRQQYKAASRWVRFCSRICNARIDWDVVDKWFMNGMIYGYSEIRYEDLIKI